MGYDVPAAVARELRLEGVLNKPVSQSQLYDCFVRLTSPAPASLRFVSGPAAGFGARLAGTVLLVEDNPVNREVALNILEEFCGAVEVASNGREAVEKVAARMQSSPYDLVLMDCQMPEMDGFAAAAEIRRRESTASTPRLPIVALTANAMQGDRQRCLEAGMDDYLAKPYSRETMHATLGRWLAPMRAQQADLDAGALEQIRALQRPGAPDILRKIVDMYLIDSARLLEDIRAAAAKGDCEALRQASHSLKSSSATLGGIALAQCCMTWSAKPAPEAWPARARGWTPSSANTQKSSPRCGPS